MEHVDDDNLAISEFYRILVKGGMSIIMVPILPNLEHTDEDPSVIDSKERLKRFGQEDHVRTYGKDFVNRLKAPGFKVSQITAKEFLTNAEIDNLGILKGSGDIFVCYK